jgi:hypothetical protein
MPRELPEYRDNYESLLAFFGNKRMLFPKEVADYCGRDPRTVMKRYRFGREGITIPTLARRMCE